MITAFVLGVCQVVSLAAFLAGAAGCLAGVFLPKNLHVERWLAVYGCTAVWGVATALFWSM